MSLTSYRAAPPRGGGACGREEDFGWVACCLRCGFFRGLAGLAATYSPAP